VAHAVNSTLYFGMGSACETGGLDTSLFFSFLDFTYRSMLEEFILRYFYLT
jgi:hypothetical protein